MFTHTTRWVKYIIALEIINLLDEQDAAVMVDSSQTGSANAQQLP